MIDRKTKMLPLTHYSYSGINREQYREEVLKTLKEYTKSVKKYAAVNWG